jgi:homoserine acetyltransferase
MLIALLKRLAVPVAIIGVAAAWLNRLKRQRQLKKAANANASGTS